MAESKACGIDGILFDFGGVMATVLRPSLFREAEARLGLPPESLADILWNSPDWRLAEVGAITDEEYWRRIGARLGLNTPAHLRRFRSTLFGDLQFDPRMTLLVQQLRGQYRVGLLSNAADSLPRQLREHFRVGGLFDVEIVSALVGLAKPNPDIYRLALERLGTQPGATIFVDDHKPNVVAAAALGIRAIHFEGYEALVQSLQDLGVL